MVFLMTNFIDTSGNLLESDVEGLVNTVNTVGVMGKGIALQFKYAFPANFKAYAKACKRQDVTLGTDVRVRQRPVQRAALDCELPD